VPIFDQGYQHWNGQLAGPAARTLAITRRGVRSGMRGLFLRIHLLLAWLPALVLAFVLCLWGLVERGSTMVSPFVKMLASIFAPQMLADPRKYRLEVWTLSFHAFLVVELYLSMILILMVGPSLISQDLRFNALPLYFSRPLRRVDYFLGKLGVIVAFLAMVIVVPSVVAYVLGLAFSLDLSIVRDTFPLLLSAVLYGLVIAVSAGLLVLALSSLSRNSRYIALFWIGIWSVSGFLGKALEAADHDQRRHAYRVASMASLPRSANPAGSAAAWRKFQEDFERAEDEARRHDWRPLVSYTGNLSRIGQQLLKTDAAWQTIANFLPPDERRSFLRDRVGPQYPWQWSAVVLAGFFGVSVLILNFRVKSLDRLK
jgi:ABC-2 type transport system permease protein